MKLSNSILFNIKLEISGELSTDESIPTLVDIITKHTQTWVDTYEDSLSGHVEDCSVSVSIRKDDNFKVGQRALEASP
jgi:hypothetical protein